MKWRVERCKDDAHNHWVVKHGSLVVYTADTWREAIIWLQRWWSVLNVTEAGWV